MAKQTKIKKFELATLNVDQIVELDGWIEKRSIVIKGSPFVEIDNPETYKTAKRNRTALKTFRTTVQNQDKTIGTFLSQFRKTTKAKSLDLVEHKKDGTKHHEDKQQIEIDRWESILQEQKDKDAKIEEDRIARIKTIIEESKTALKALIDNMKFSEIDQTKNIITLHITNRLENDFEEFDFLYDEMTNEHWNFYNQKEEQLIKVESDRLDQLEKDQEAKLNKMKLDCIELIDGANEFIEGHSFDGSLKNILDVEFNFGTFTDQFKEMKVSMYKKAEIKTGLLVDQSDRKKEEKITNQKDSVIKLREGSLDLIFQMTVDNHKCNTGTVKGTWTQDFTASVPLAMDEVLKARQMVNKALDRKLSEIATDLQTLEDEKNKKEKFLKERHATRIEMAKKEGLKLANGTLSGFGFDVCANLLIHSDEDEFDEWIKTVNTGVKAFKSNDKKEKAKDKKIKAEIKAKNTRIKSERETLIKWIDENLRNHESKKNFKQPEIAKFESEMINEIEGFCNELIKDLKEI